MSEWKHIRPVNDLREHVTEGRSCWCNPQLDDEHSLIIHNAMDQRDKREYGEIKSH